MLPDMVMQINGIDVVIPGLAGDIVGGILYYLVGLALVGRRCFSKWIVGYGSSLDAPAVVGYGFIAGVLSALWPVVIPGKWFGKGIGKLMASPAARECIKDI